MSEHRRRTRILATLGPATDPPGVLDALLRAGVDVVRLNFSHGDPSAQASRAQAVREAARARRHRGRHPRRPAGPEDPHREIRRTTACSCAPAIASTCSRARMRRSGDADAGRRQLSRPARRRARRRRAAARRRRRAAAGDGGRGRAHRHHRAQRLRAVQSQGPEQAGRRTLARRADRARQGTDRHRRADRRRLHRRVVSAATPRT